MKTLFLALSIVAPFSSLSAQTTPSQPPSAKTADQLPHHVVMITRAGPNFSKLADFPAERKAHFALWQGLASQGYTVAGGPFEGQPVMGMTIFREGIDETHARELMKEDQFPKLGITQIEFRTFIVTDGSLERS